MSTSLITTGAFLPVLNKHGKVTKTAEKVSAILNSMDAAGIQSAAVHGKGAIQVQALRALAPSAQDVAAMLAAERPQWGTILAQMAAEHGVQHLNRAHGNGRAGALAYVGLMVKAAELRFDSAETVKQQESAEKALKAARSLADLVSETIQRESAAIEAARTAREALAAAVAETAETETAETAE